mgnify:CR=1 FL=1
MESLVIYITNEVINKCAIELNVLERDIEKLKCVKKPFPRITYDEAVKLLKDNGHEFKYGSDFGAPDEELIASKFDSPVMIHSWPHETKAFYMKRDDTDKLAWGVDVIAPEGYGEIVGGGQREDDHDTLLSRIKDHKLPIDPFQWYLRLFIRIS